MRPADDEYAPFYAGYVSLVPEPDVLAVLGKQADLVARLAASVPPERESFAYAPGKWTVRQVFGHLVDGERVLGHRAFRISRSDATPLPGFDEDAFVARSPYARVPLADLASEFSAVRRGNLAVLRVLDAPAWEARGTANGAPVSVRALAFILAGHVRHHLGVLRERYGVEG